MGLKSTEGARLYQDQRKTIPGTRQNSGVVANPPDVPQTTFKIVPNLGKSVPEGHRRRVTVDKQFVLAEKNNSFETDDNNDGTAGQSTLSYVVPVIPLAPVEFKVVRCGGGRPIGGGTSSEALRRSRQKARREKSARMKRERFSSTCSST